MKVINVIHMVRGNAKESKVESMEQLREIGKIRKMEEGDVHEQPMVHREILALHNLEHLITLGP